MSKRRLREWFRRRLGVRDSLKKIHSNRRYQSDMDRIIRDIMAEKIWHFPKESQ